MENSHMIYLVAKKEVALLKNIYEQNRASPIVLCAALFHFIT